MHKSIQEQFISTHLTIWNNLNAKEKELILNNTVLSSYSKGQNIHSIDHDCIGVLLVHTGELRTYILSEEGKEVTLYRLYPGEICILSASCILKNITFDVHVDSESLSEVFIINPHIFQQISDQNIYVEKFAYQSTTERFSDVMWIMEQILFMSFDKRLAIFLLDEVSKSHTDYIHLTQEQIAKYIGSAREVVSRMLKYFQSENIVEVSRGSIKIKDKQKLQNLL